MAATCINYDEWIARWHAELYRFCLVLALDTKAAEEMTFQAYLRLGVGQSGMEEASTRTFLYSAAFLVSEAYHLQKLRRRPGLRKLCELLGTEKTDPLIAYLRMPFQCRASAYLLHIAAFSPEEAGKILRVRPSRAMRLGNIPKMDRIRAACHALRLGEGAQNDLSDRLYTRLSERNVAFETRMLDMRYRLDRFVPYLALPILILFICAVCYSLHAGG